MTERCNTKKTAWLIYDLDLPLLEKNMRPALKVVIALRRLPSARHHFEGVVVFRHDFLWPFAL